MSESLADVRQEAKNAFKYWGLFLEVQRRRVLKHVHESTLSAAGYLPASVGTVPGSPELTVLQAGGLPLPTDLHAYFLPALTPLAASGRFSFWAGAVPELPGSVTLNLLRWQPSGALERAELMRAAPQDGWYLRRAAETFNATLDTEGIDLVFNAAKLWASFHAGAVVLPFVALAPEILTAHPGAVPSMMDPDSVTDRAEEEDDFRMVIESFQGADDW